MCVSECVDFEADVNEETLRQMCLFPCSIFVTISLFWDESFGLLCNYCDDGTPDQACVDWHFFNKNICMV